MPTWKDMTTRLIDTDTSFGAPMEADFLVVNDA